MFSIKYEGWIIFEGKNRWSFHSYPSEFIAIAELTRTHPEEAAELEKIHWSVQ